MENLFYLIYLNSNFIEGICLTKNSNNFNISSDKINFIEKNKIAKDNKTSLENNNWINILDEGTLYNFATNDVSGSILDIGFIFPFYNENYDSIIINANGWVGFGEDNAEWDNATIPSNAAPSPAIFPFWDDLNPVNDSCNDYCSGNVYYHGNEERFVITFNEVAHWWTNYENSFYTFQVVLYPSGLIDINYREMQGLKLSPCGR